MKDCGAQNTIEISNASEKTISTALSIPLCIAIAYIYVLRLISSGWPQSSSTFSECSIYLPIIGSISYLLAVYYGKKYMSTTEVWNVKEYMFIYNVYQTVLNIWCVYSFLYEIFKNDYPFWGNICWSNTDMTTNYQMSFFDLVTL